MWKAFARDGALGVAEKETRFPRVVVAQADGCAPLVRAFRAGAESATAWENPTTHAAGLRVPGPLGDRLVLRALRESGGEAESASEDAIRRDTRRLAEASGIDAAPEGGCALAVTRQLVKAGRLAPRCRGRDLQHGQRSVLPLRLLGSGIRSPDLTESLASDRRGRIIFSGCADSHSRSFQRHFRGYDPRRADRPRVERGVADVASAAARARRRDGARPDVRRAGIACKKVDFDDPASAARSTPQPYPPDPRGVGRAADSSRARPTPRLPR